MGFVGYPWEYQPGQPHCTSLYIRPDTKLQSGSLRNSEEFITVSGQAVLQVDWCQVSLDRSFPRL